MKKIFIIIFAVFVFSAWIDPFKDEVEKGNNSYNNKELNKALEHYKMAEKYLPDEKSKAMLDFNKGDAHYQSGNYDIAVDKFKNSISSENPDIQKKALFNIGNSYLKQKKYKEAADNFIKALEIDPAYEKAKKNLEYLLKEQKKKDQNENDGSRADGEKGNSKDKSMKDKQDNETMNNENKMKNIQTRNLLESMKNKPVRKQKGKGDGKRYLEKFW